jgi:hypothetical protein
MTVRVLIEIAYDSLKRKRKEVTAMMELERSHKTDECGVRLLEANGWTRAQTNAGLRSRRHIGVVRHLWAQGESAKQCWVEVSKAPWRCETCEHKIVCASREVHARSLRAQMKDTINKLPR